MRRSAILTIFLIVTFLCTTLVCLALDSDGNEDEDNGGIAIEHSQIDSVDLPLVECPQFVVEGLPTDGFWKCAPLDFDPETGIPSKGLAVKVPDFLVPLVSMMLNGGQASAEFKGNLVGNGIADGWLEFHAQNIHAVRAYTSTTSLTCGYGCPGPSFP